MEFFKHLNFDISSWIKLCQERQTWKMDVKADTTYMSLGQGLVQLIQEGGNT